MPSDDDLINRLLTRAGAIMEDASVLAIVDDGARTSKERVAALRKAALTVIALTDAADSIMLHPAL